MKHPAPLTGAIGPLSGILLINLKQTCEAAPSQWQGQTTKGDFVYIHYRYGRLRCYRGVRFRPDGDLVLTGDLVYEGLYDDPLGAEAMTTGQMLEITGLRIVDKASVQTFTGWLDGEHRRKDAEIARLSQEIEAYAVKQAEDLALLLRIVDALGVGDLVRQGATIEEAVLGSIERITKIVEGIENDARQARQIVERLDKKPPC